MKHDIVWREFRSTLPKLVYNVVKWFPCGQDTIRVRYADDEEFIFSRQKDGIWSIETLDHFVSRLKGDQKM